MKRTTELREYDVGRLDVDIVMRWIDARICAWEVQVGIVACMCESTDQKSPNRPDEFRRGPKVSLRYADRVNMLTLSSLQEGRH